MRTETESLVLCCLKGLYALCWPEICQMTDTCMYIEGLSATGSAHLTC